MGYSSFWNLEIKIILDTKMVLQYINSSHEALKQMRTRK
jgi:hypothetical protein